MSWLYTVTLHLVVSKYLKTVVCQSNSCGPTNMTNKKTNLII